MSTSSRVLGICVMLCTTFVPVAGKSSVQADVIPVFKLDGPITESPSEIAGLLGDGKPRTLGDLVGRMRQAGADAAVPAVVLLIASPSVGAAQVQELCGAMGRLREQSKDVYVFAESLTIGNYLLCTGASSISLVPGGVLALTGLNPESMYVRGLLDKIGVVPNIVHIGDYKSAGETFTRTGPSEAATEQMNRLIDDIYLQMVERVARSRNFSQEQAESVLTSGPYSAEKALEAGLIDSVKYRKEFLTGVERKYGAEIKTDYGGTKKFELDFSSPFALFQLFSEMMAKAQPDSGNAIAVVQVEGLIVDGKSTESGMMGRTAGSWTLRKALEEAAEDESIKAVVLRVDSPGGSALASEVIWKSTQRVRQSKPLIVSMGNVAGSGGYYVACGADKIFADEATITGSIGVLGGKFITRELWTKMGVNWHEMPRGRHARLFSTLAEFSDEERETIRAFMDETYVMFKSRVSQGRGEAIQGDLEPLAGGRVYTGRQALEIGLIDEIGGLHAALAFAAKSAGLTDYRTRTLPKPRTLFDLLAEAAGLDDGEIRGPAMKDWTAGPLLRAALPLISDLDTQRARALVRALGIAQLLSMHGVVTATPFELIIR